MQNQELQNDQIETLIDAYQKEIYLYITNIVRIHE